MSAILCGYCGHLNWTIERYGTVTHKHDCPHRRDPWCQSHEKLCVVFPTEEKE